VDETAQGIPFEEYWRAVLKRWRLIALSVGIALTIAALYSILSQRLYRASVMLDVEPERPNAFDISSAPSAYYYIGSEFLVTNAVADAYIAWNLESKYGVAGRASEYFAAQIQQTKAELDAKAQQLLAYGREKDIVTADPQATLYVQKIELNLDAAVADRVAKE